MKTIAKFKRIAKHVTHVTQDCKQNSSRNHTVPLASHISWQYASFQIQSEGGEKDKVQTLASGWKKSMTVSGSSLRAVTSCNSKLPCVSQGLIYIQLLRQPILTSLLQERKVNFNQCVSSGHRPVNVLHQ